MKITNKEFQYRITTNILKIMNKNNVTVGDISRVTKIKVERLNNLLNTNINTTIKIKELYHISMFLDVSIDKLINNLD